MATMGISLNTVGLSQARGVQLIATREQLDATLPKAQSPVENTRAAAKSASEGLKSRELSPEQQQQVQELVRIDREVRAHEAAHIAAGAGVVTSGASFSYTYGPDGKQYAVGGEVGIDTSAEDEPEANIDKGQRIQSAALAPAEPSSQDYQVAQVGARLVQKGHTDLAAQMAAEQTAQMEAARERREAASGKDSGSGTAPDQAMREALNRTYSLTAPESSRASGLSLFA